MKTLRTATFQDIRFGMRVLQKSPGYTAVSILALALGIGASTAVFGVLNALFFNPVPGPTASRLVQIGVGDMSSREKSGLNGVSTEILRFLRTKRDFFSDIAWFHGMALEFGNDDFKTAVAGEMVSPNFFQILNSPPLLGRVFTQADAAPMDRNRLPERDSVIVINHSLWKSRFGGDPAIIGESVVMSGRRFKVVGVMPEYFQFPRARESFWTPAEDPRPGPDALSEIAVFACLKSDVTEGRTQGMLASVSSQFASDSTGRELDDESARSKSIGLQARSLCNHFPKNPGIDNFQRTLFSLLAAMGFVLLIACFNVANLALARTEKRQREFSIRSALGAGRFRLARQLMTESVVLGFLGGLAGLWISVMIMQYAASIIPVNMQRMRALSVDSHTLLFALAATVAATLLCGLPPAWQASQVSMGETLKQAGVAVTLGKNRMRFRSLLVVAEVAMSLVLLAGAGLMTQSVLRLLAVNPGFDPENLLYVNLWLPGKYSDSVDSKNGAQLRNDLFARFQEQLFSIPGVMSVGIYGGGLGDGKLVLDGQPGAVAVPGTGCGAGQSDFFRAMRIPLLAGRYFEPGDINENSGAVIINEKMARQFWQSQSPLGKVFTSVESSGVKRRFEVVGVTADTRLARYIQKPGPEFFRPCQNAVFDGDAPSVLVVIRTERDPRIFAAAIRDKLKSVEPNLWNPRINVASQVLYDSTQLQRASMFCLVCFAGTGLALSALGIFAILAQSVASRAREIGIRMALGANPRQVRTMILTEGMRLVAVGVGAGLLDAYWLAHLLASQLFEVKPTDPIILSVVVLFLCLVALLACWMPARRATKVDPMEALRSE